MKRIYSLLAAALMLAGTALWSGCSNNDLLDNDNTTGSGTSQEVESLNFSIKKSGAQTRATVDDLTKPEESLVKTVYVALFLKDNADEKNSKLHRIYCYDDKAGADWSALKITETDGTYTIPKPGTVGDYVVYFIANPDKKIKDDLLAMHKETTNRATLGSFESTLQTSDKTADGKTNDEGVVQTEADKQRGFIMVGKENVTLSERTNISVTLNRLAARFDFINSAATTTDNEVVITKVEFNQGAQNSIVAASSTLTATNRLTNLAYDKLNESGGAWTTQVGNYFTAYTYENLITDDAINRTYITVYYTLTPKSGTSENKKLNINLKEESKFIGVTRNHLYRIYLNGVSGQFKLTVADWEEGNTVSIPNEELAIVFDPANPQKNFYGKIGDYACISAATGELYFADGGLRSIALDGTMTFTTIPALTSTQKSECVGLVFSNNTSEAEKAAGFDGGQVVALRNIGPTFWGTEMVDLPEITNISTVGELVSDLDGYQHCQILGREPAKYPLYNAVTKHTPALPTGKTSGWYLPSGGQYCTILMNLADANNLKNLSTNTTVFTDGAEINYNMGKDINANLENRLKMLNAGSYDTFNQIEYISSSERNDKTVGYLYFKTTSIDLAGFASKMGSELTKRNARPVFSFKR